MVTSFSKTAHTLSGRTQLEIPSRGVIQLAQTFFDSVYKYLDTTPKFSLQPHLSNLPFQNNGPPSLPLTVINVRLSFSALTESNASMDHNTGPHQQRNQIMCLRQTRRHTYVNVGCNASLVILSCQQQREKHSYNLKPGSGRLPDTDVHQFRRIVNIVVMNCMMTIVHIRCNLTACALTRTIGNRLQRRKQRKSQQCSLCVQWCLEKVI